jgi:hypothetical protein
MRRGRRWSSRSSPTSHLELLLDQPRPPRALPSSSRKQRRGWRRRCRWFRGRAGVAPPVEVRACGSSTATATDGGSPLCRGRAGAAPPGEVRARGSRTGTAGRRRFILARYIISHPLFSSAPRLYFRGRGSRAAWRVRRQSAWCLRPGSQLPALLVRFFARLIS